MNEASHVLGQDYCLSSEIPSKFPNLFTHAQWEWAMRNRSQNGVGQAVRKVGGRLFINLPVLVEVIEGSHEP